MILNKLNNNNTFLFILIVLLILILFNTSNINCFRSNNDEPFIFKKSSRFVKGTYKSGKNKLFGIEDSKEGKEEKMSVLNFKVKKDHVSDDLKENDIVEFYYNEELLLFRFVVVSSEIDKFNSKYIKINVKDTETGIVNKVTKISNIYDNYSKILYNVKVSKIGENNKNFILSKRISFKNKMGTEYSNINSPCYINFSEIDEYDNKQHVKNLNVGDQIKLHSIGDIEPSDITALGTIESINIPDKNQKHRLLFLNNSNLCDIVGKNGLNISLNEDVLLEIIKPIPNNNNMNTTEAFANSLKHNFIHLGDIIGSPTNKFSNKKLKENNRINQFTFIIHKNYVKEKLKPNDIIYFQRNVDDINADKILYLIIHSIKTNPDKSDYFNITIKDKSSIITKKHSIINNIFIKGSPYSNVKSYDPENKNDFKLVKIGTNREDFVLSEDIKLIKTNNNKFIIFLSSSNRRENIENRKPFKVNDSLIIHSIDSNIVNEENLLIDKIEKNNDNYILFLDVNSSINKKNLSVVNEPPKEILIEINNFEKKLTDFIEKPLDDYVRLRYNQLNIDKLTKKLIALKNELNNENNL